MTVSLLFDLGLPWRIYMPIFHWQYHSVMFEIAWCVMLYFTVLNLEFGSVILEHRWFQHPIFQSISRFLHLLTIPIVIAGIALSTLHHSSLGSLFLIMPFRVHPLWYSPFIPIFFFITSIGLGLMAVVLDGFLAAWLFDRQLHFRLLSQLGKVAGYVLWLYLILRLGDLAWRGIIPTALDGSWQSVFFGVEIVIGGILPATLLLIPAVRNGREGLITCGVLTIFGIVTQRISLSMLTMCLPARTSYIPSMLEVAIAFAVPAAAGLIYLFFAEHLAVFQKEVPKYQPTLYARPQFGRDSHIYVEDSFVSTFTRRSGLAVLAIALTLALLPSNVVNGDRPLSDTPVKPALGWEMLIINGNRNKQRVDFNHLAHQEDLQVSFEAVDINEDVCLTCHHLSKPNDEATACWECHQDMYRPSSIFDHTWHQVELGDNASCGECHQGEHTAATAKPCAECHETMVAEPGEAMFNSLSPDYKDAMHGAVFLATNRKQSCKPSLN